MKIAPPTWLEAIVSAMLPPSKREQVLGDLAERRQHRASGYLRDVVFLVPQVAWRALWRSPLHRQMWVAGGAPQMISLRRRAEAVQDELWRRRCVQFCVLGALWISVIDATLAGNRSSLTLLFILYLNAGLQSVLFCRIAAPVAIPAEISLSDLTAIHRQGLTLLVDTFGAVGFAVYPLVCWFGAILCIPKAVHYAPHDPWMLIAASIFLPFFTLWIHRLAKSTGRFVRKERALLHRLQDEIRALDAYSAS